MTVRTPSTPVAADETPFAPVSLDENPRIEARRHGVERQRAVQRRRAALVAAAVVGVIALGILVVRSPLVDVDHIRVTGSNRATTEEIVAASGLDHDASLVTLDTGRIAARVEAVPWVDEASVVRRWPGTVEITVTERTPAAFAALEGEVALVSVDGRVVERQPLDDRSVSTLGLVELTGLRALPSAGETLFPQGIAAVGDAVPGGLAARLVAVDLSRNDDVVLVLDGAPEIRLGSLDDIASKGAAALAVLEHLGEEADALVFIDVRVPTTPIAGGTGGRGHIDPGSPIPSLDAPLQG